MKEALKQLLSTLLEAIKKYCNPGKCFTYSTENNLLINYGINKDNTAYIKISGYHLVKDDKVKGNITHVSIFNEPIIYLYCTLDNSNQVKIINTQTLHNEQIEKQLEFIASNIEKIKAIKAIQLQLTEKTTAEKPQKTTYNPYYLAIAIAAIGVLAAGFVTKLLANNDPSSHTLGT